MQSSSKLYLRTKPQKSSDVSKKGREARWMHSSRKISLWKSIARKRSWAKSSTKAFASRWREHELWPVAMITGSCHSKPNFCLLSGPDAKIDDLVELLAVATCLSLLGRSKRVHSVLRMQMQQTTRIQREQNKFR